jgi:hypothetical protein
MPHLHPRTPEPRAFLARATPAAVAYARPPPDSPRAGSRCSHASPCQTAAPELHLHAPAQHAPPVPNPFQNFSLDQNLLELGSPLPHLVYAAATTAKAAFWPLQPRNGTLNSSCIASLVAAASPALQRQPLPPTTRAWPSLRAAAALAPRASALRPAPATAAAPLLGAVASRRLPRALARARLRASCATPLAARAEPLPAPAPSRRLPRAWARLAARRAAACARAPASARARRRLAHAPVRPRARRLLRLQLPLPVRKRGGKRGGK